MSLWCNKCARVPYKGCDSSCLLFGNETAANEKTVCLSFKNLYKENGSDTKYGHYIDFYSDGDTGTEYYDLRTESFDLCACDGELFDLVEIDKNNDRVKLINHEGENNMIVLLSIEEYEICRFK